MKTLFQRFKKKKKMEKIFMGINIWIETKKRKKYFKDFDKKKGGKYSVQ